MHYSIFALILAVLTQGLNLLFIKLEIFKDFSFEIRMMFMILVLTPFVLFLNWLFAIYYKSYSVLIPYSSLYVLFIVFSVLISFIIQYSILETTTMNLYKILGIILAVISIYLILH